MTAYRLLEIYGETPETFIRPVMKIPGKLILARDDHERAAHNRG
jgi:hypothetical protein